MTPEKTEALNALEAIYTGLLAENEQLREQVRLLTTERNEWERMYKLAESAYRDSERRHYEFIGGLFPRTKTG